MSAKGFLKTSFAAAAVGGGLYACFPEDREHSRELLEIARICASDRPIVVIDTFSARTPDFGIATTEKDIDLNGDGENDISHGDLVAALYEASGKTVLTYGMTSLLDRSFLSDLNNITKIIEAGAIEKPSAVSMSVSKSTDIISFQLRFDFIADLTPATLREKRLDMIRVSEAPGTSPHHDNSAPFHDYLEIFSKLESAGIPVLTGAGNDGNTNAFNIFAMLGATSIGALTADGSEIAPYSNVNALTSQYRVGDVVTRLLDDGGIDITGDEIAEFPASQVSDGVPLAHRFNGTSAIEGLIAGTLIDISGGSNRFSSQYGSVRTFGDFAQIYRVNPDHTLTFDPLGNGDPRQVNLISGTSFALPNLCNG